MARGEEEDKLPTKITDIEALRVNVQEAVDGFHERWMSMPEFSEHCTVMDLRQLRDAMGLRSTFEAGDPWPAAENLLLQYGFRWHWLGGSRVMFLQERDNYQPDTGWEDAEEAE